MPAIINPKLTMKNTPAKNTMLFIGLGNSSATAQLSLSTSLYGYVQLQNGVDLFPSPLQT